MPLDLGIMIPQYDSVRVLMRIAERMDWRKLSGAYERESSSWEATPKQMFLLIVPGFTNGLYSTRPNERACRCDIRFMWLLTRFINRIGGGIMEDRHFRRLKQRGTEGVFTGLFFIPFFHVLSCDLPCFLLCSWSFDHI